MGQVPTYAVLGDGAAARHFVAYLAGMGIPFSQWSRRAGARLADTVSDADTVLLLLKDSAIESFILDHSEALRGRRLVHFSGSLVTPHAYGMHPLMTFTREGALYPLDVYRSMAFVCDQGGPGFSEVFPALPNPSYVLTPEQKALYHSLCVMSGNFTVMLWQKFFRDLETKLGIPAGAAHPYLSRIADNLRTDAQSALSGPIQRRDHETIARNLASLDGDAYQDVYRSFVSTVTPEVSS